MAKTKVLNLRISPELKKKAKQVAENDGRSLSNWITHLITREVKKAEKGEKTEND
jgi:predicted HicB family RNase H-like nuclease